MQTLLVSAAQVAANPDWRIFDCRHDLANPAAGTLAFADGHLPGALHLHLDRDMSGPMNGRNGRHPLPVPKIFAARLAELGIGPRTQVVAYDSQGGIYAARLWWLLRWIGHQQVAVLDGGFAAWQSAGFALEKTPACFAPSDLIAHPSSGSATVDANQLLGSLAKADLLVVDARSAERFAGHNETLDPVAGHIPGAKNRFFQNNLLVPNGRFKAADDLRAEFSTLLAGVAADNVVHQCGSGVTACHNLLAMEVAGLIGSRLYPGSWSEWVSDSSRPVVGASSASP